MEEEQKSQIIRAHYKGMSIEAERVNGDDDCIKYKWLRHPDVATVDSSIEEKSYAKDLTDEEIMEEIHKKIDLHWEALKDKFGETPNDWAVNGDKLLAGVRSKVVNLEGRLKLLEGNTTMDDVDKMSIVCALSRLFHGMDKFESGILLDTLSRIGEQEGKA